MTKKEQIRALQAENDWLVKERDEARESRTRYKAALARCQAERERSLPEQVRREFHARWDDLMRAVGL